MLWLQLQRQQLALNLRRLLLLFFYLYVCFTQLLRTSNQVAALLNELRVGPGLLDEIGSAPLQGFYGQLNGPPGCNDQNGNCRIEFADAGDEVETFGARGGVERVIEIHDQQIKLTRVQRLQHRGGMHHGLRLESLELQQQRDGMEDVRLIIGHKYPLGLGGQASLSSQGSGMRAILHRSLRFS